MDNLENKSSVWFHGKKWELSEEERLFSLFNKWVSIKDLSQIFQRTTWAIWKRLKILLNKNEKNVDIYRFFDKENEKMIKTLTNNLISTNYVWVNKIATYISRKYDKKILGSEINKRLCQKWILIEKNNENWKKEKFPTKEAEKYWIFQQKSIDKKTWKEYQAIVFTEKWKTLIIDNINEIEKNVSVHKEWNKDTNSNYIGKRDNIDTNIDAKWTEKDDIQLIFLFKEWRDTKKIADFFGRNEWWIMSRLNEIWLIKHNSGVRYEDNHTKELQNEELKLFEELRKVRLKLATEEKMPPYIIFSDAVLKDITKNKPLTEEDMLKIKWIRSRKFEKYGHMFMKKIKEFWCEKKEEIQKEREIKKSSKINFDLLVNKVTEYYNLNIADIKSDSRKKEITETRQFLMFLAKKHFNRTLERIGDYFGGKWHAAVIYAIKNIENKLKKEKNLENDYRIFLHNFL